MSSGSSWREGERERGREREGGREGGRGAKLELYSSFVQNFGNVILDHPPLIVLHMYMYATNNEVFFLSFFGKIERMKCECISVYTICVT